MVWGKAGTTTLQATSGTVEVASLSNSKFYTVMEYLLDTDTNNNNYIRFGNTTVDTGSNYATRYSQDGAGDTLSANSDVIIHGYFGNTMPKFMVNYILNISGEEKLVIAHAVDQKVSGAGTAPSRNETVGKWANTSNPMGIWQSRSSASGAPSGYSSYAIGSNVSVLGSDIAATAAVATKVQDGAIFYETDTNKSYVLSSDTWTEL